MLIFVMILALTITVLINIVTSCYVCYNVAIDTNAPGKTLLTVFGVVLLNALFPYVAGCMTGLWWIM